MVLLLSPHQQQEWHVDEAELDYSFLIFREDFKPVQVVSAGNQYVLHSAGLQICQDTHPE